GGAWDNSLSGHWMF
nr:immunoglobulin light chain junction region [Macaca mulatta]